MKQVLTAQQIRYVMVGGVAALLGGVALAVYYTRQVGTANDISGTPSPVPATAVLTTTAPVEVTSSATPISSPESSATPTATVSATPSASPTARATPSSGVRSYTAADISLAAKQGTCLISLGKEVFNLTAAPAELNEVKAYCGKAVDDVAADFAGGSLYGAERQGELESLYVGSLVE